MATAETGLTHLRVGEFDRFAGLKLFRGVSRSALIELACHLERRRFKRDEVIYHQGDIATGLFILIRGGVKHRIVLPDDRQLTLQWQSEGTAFGLNSLLSGEPRLNDVVAVEPCETLMLPREKFLAFLWSNAEAMKAMLHVMADRERHKSELMNDMVLLDLPRRLAKTLLRLSRRSSGNSKPAFMYVQMRQSELACILGATRESTNKWLRYFEQKGWIEIRRGFVEIFQPDDLISLIENDTQVKT